MSYITRECDYCGKEYEADTRNLNRGWGKTCSKSCAAYKREQEKEGFIPELAKYNKENRTLSTPSRKQYKKMKTDKEKIRKDHSVQNILDQL